MRIGQRFARNDFRDGDGDGGCAPRPVEIFASRISLCIPFCRQVEVELKLKLEDYEHIWCFVNDV